MATKNTGIVNLGGTNVNRGNAYGPGAKVVDGKVVRGEKKDNNDKKKKK